MLKSHIAGQPHRIRQSSPRASISLRTAAQRRSRSLSDGVGYSTSLRMALRPPAFACRGRAYDIGSHAAMAAGAPRGRVVMRGLDPRIHRLCEKALRRWMDCRVISAFTRVFRRAMPGNDELG